MTNQPQTKKQTSFNDNNEWIKKICYYPLYDYGKVFYYDKQNHNKPLTGTAIRSDTLGKLIVIDVDNEIKEKIEKNQIEYENNAVSLLQNNYVNFIKKFVPQDTSNVYIEQTASYGLHIFLINDLIDDDLKNKISQNRFVKILKNTAYQSDLYDIDVFIPCSCDTDKKSIVDVAKPHCDGLRYEEYDEETQKVKLSVPLLNRTNSKSTRIRLSQKFNRQITSMQIISKCDNFILTTLTITQYLQWLYQKENIDLKTLIMNKFQQSVVSNKKPIEEQLKSTNNSNKKTTQKIKPTLKQFKIQIPTQKYNSDIPIAEYLNLVVNLLTDVEIHNYSGSNIKTEISLLPVFRSIMFLPQQYWQDIIDKVYSVSLLTPNARKNYYSTWNRVKETQQPFNDLSILTTMITYNDQKKYQQYKEEIKKIVYTSLHPYEANDVIKSRQNCINFSEDINGARVFNSIHFSDYYSVSDWFIDVQKVMIFDTTTRSHYIKYRKEGQNYHYLERISLQDIRTLLRDHQINNVSMIEYFLKNDKYLNYEGITTMSDRKDIFSTFQSYYYKPIQNDALIQDYLQHIKKVICSNDNQKYEYLLNLFAFYFQNPVSQSGVALVITGPQGSGKNTLTNPLIQLMGCYGKEVNDIDNVLGQFNPILENTHLLVCNEMTRCDYNSKKANFDKLKSLITEKYIQLNQKNEVSRTIDNMLNFIILSNHQKPIDLDDDTNRRYCVIRTDKRQDEQYYENIYRSFEQEGFKEALMYFFMTRDISQFKPQRDMPQTKETKELIELSMNSIQLFVIKSQIQKVNTLKNLFEAYKSFLSNFGGKHQGSNGMQTFKIQIQQFYEQKRNSKHRWYQLKQEYVQEKDMNYDFYIPLQLLSSNETEYVESQIWSSMLQEM